MSSLQIDHHNPPTLHRNPAFTQVVTVRGATKLVFVGGQPCVVTPAGELVNVLALHFQGSAKIAMAHVLHGRVHTVALLTAALRLARRAKNWAFGMRRLAQRPAGGTRFAGAAGPK